MQLSVPDQDSRKGIQCKFVEGWKVVGIIQDSKYQSLSNHSNHNDCDIWSAADCQYQFENTCTESLGDSLEHPILSS